MFHENIRKKLNV